MGLSLKVFDGQNNTGGSVQVTGSPVGSTNVVAYQAVNGQKLGSSPWLTAATLTGDGNANVALSAGYYWWMLTSTAAGVPTIAPLVYQNFSDDAKAVYDRIVDGVVARLQGLIFAPPPNGRAPQVFRFKDDEQMQAGLPAVVASIFDLDIAVEPEDFENEDHVFYPVKVTITDRVSIRDQAATGTYLLWSQQCSRALRNQRLPGVPEDLDCEVSQWKAISQAAGAYQRQESSFLATFRAAEVFG